MPPFQCVICLEENLPEEKEVILPCCGKNRKSDKKSESSSSSSSYIHYCSECILTLASSDSEHNIRCPTCREYLKVEEKEQQQRQQQRQEAKTDDAANKNKTVSVTIRKDMGHCAICNQIRTLIRPHLCAACHLGRQYPLVYSCENCPFYFQRIPHPMWRYQRTPNENSTETWFCQNCQKFSHWKIHQNDVQKIPPFDVPESWNTVGVRELIQVMRNNVGVLRNQHLHQHEYQHHPPFSFTRRMFSLIFPSTENNPDAKFIYMIYFLIIAKLISLWY